MAELLEFLGWGMLLLGGIGLIVLPLYILIIKHVIEKYL